MRHIPERFTTAYLARLAGVRAVLVDYHLAPECPFPTAFEGGGGFYAQDDPMMRADFLMRQLTTYRGEADPRTPLLSPLYANLQGLPPILVQVGEAELFRSGAAAADPEHIAWQCRLASLMEVEPTCTGHVCVWEINRDINPIAPTHR
jgi:acetyl esterase/lipase